MRQPAVVVRVAALCLLAAGCAHYEPKPLPSAAHLAATLAALKNELPGSNPRQAPLHVDVTAPLDIDRIGLLAMLNDPDLASERGEIDVAQASLLETSLLPNPSIGLGYQALIGGPATSPAYTASLSEDITALVTYRARLESERAAFAQVSAEQLWREWQVAQKARLLALDVYWGQQSIDLTEHELEALSAEVAPVQAATAAGNLDLSALAPLEAATASAEQSLASLNQDQLKNRQALDALLGLMPDVRFAISPPLLPPLPQDLDARVAALPDQRPDLVALQLGYRSSEETLRAAVLGQFPAFIFGLAWGSDTSDVRSAGPNITFDLPLFNRNQGHIAQARASRELLREQYQARLDGAIADIRGLQAQAEHLSSDLDAARRAVTSARARSDAAQQAYAQGNLDQRGLSDYQTAALQREIEVASLERSLGELRIMLGIELGLGLPNVRIASAEPGTPP